MMRSMFSGVTGLKSHQTKMDVVGNNVANVNTVGFKSGRVLFQEVFNQTIKNASSPEQTSGRGGTNPMQVGLGLGIAAIDTNMARGTLQRTDNPLDISIEGEGFFVVKSEDKEIFKFTRAGNFQIDKAGNITTPSGQILYGWQEFKDSEDGTKTFLTEKPISPMNVFNDSVNGNKRSLGAKAVTQTTLIGNLDASNSIVDPALATTKSQFTVPVNVFDSLGNDYPLNIEFYKTKVEEVTQTLKDANGNTVFEADGVTPKTEDVSESTWTWKLNSTSNLSITPAQGTLVFNDSGAIKDPTSSTAKPTIELIPDKNVVGSATMNVQLNFSDITTYRDTSSVKPSYIDGYKPGNLLSFSIGPDGIITGIYSNGQQKPLGMVGLAVFENPSGLKKYGENLFTTSTNSGEYRNPVMPGTNGAGLLNPSTLEMSNVDLSKEFTEMIITQRGFQANGRIITASDEMLQELMSIKR